MTPRPDHGETSYRGSGRLPTRKALVTGGDSGIGRAATIAFAHEGADVAISHLPSEEVDAKEVITLIEAEGRKAFALPGDISNEKFARKLVKDARKKRSISYSTLRLNCGNEQLSRILPIAPINKVMAQKANPASTWQVSAPGLMRPTSDNYEPSLGCGTKRNVSHALDETANRLATLEDFLQPQPVSLGSPVLSTHRKHSCCLPEW